MVESLICHSKKDNNGNIDFSVDAETKGLKGRAEERKKLELKEQAQMATLIKELDVKNPELISDVLFTIMDNLIKLTN